MHAQFPAQCDRLAEFDWAILSADRDWPVAQAAPDNAGGPNILNRALIADELPLCIAHDMRVLRNPDARPIATVNFRLEIEHLPLRFHDMAKLITAIAIDVEAVLDV